jgi:hypothetical protein
MSIEQIIRSRALTLISQRLVEEINRLLMLIRNVIIAEFGSRFNIEVIVE